MNETKHTPGRWTVSRAPGWAPRYLVMDGIVVVCEVSGVGEKALLTAHKLAAASDLLEALETMYEICDMSGDESDHRMKAKAAIKKAKGTK